jgi:hypothetical protein
MTYWWNKNYTTTLADGTEVHPEWYEGHDLKSLGKGAFVNWDIEHACRKPEDIEEWVKKHPPLPPGTPAESDIPGTGQC